MKTDALIDALATGAGPAPRAVVARRMAPAMTFGLLASAGLALAVLGIVPPNVFEDPLWWVKFGYAVALSAACAWAAARMARPGARIANPWGVVAAVAAVMVLLGVEYLIVNPAETRLALVMGSSASVCPWRILMLSIPALAAVLWALRGLAPTRLRVAGLAAGLLAGAVGATGYALACPETSMTFVAIWYSLGIVMTGALGALLGPRVLRW
jgi:hypothetical protein